MIHDSRLVFITTLVGFAALSEQWGPEIKDDPNRQYVDAKNCGTTDDLAQRIEICAKPVLDLVQGTLEKWPKNINDARDLCVSVSIINTILFIDVYLIFDSHLQKNDKIN